MGANSGPTSSGAMPNFMIALTSSLIKLVNATIFFLVYVTGVAVNLPPIWGR